MGLTDPRIQEIQAAVMRRPDLPRSHFRLAYGVGSKKMAEWCEAGLLHIPKQKPKVRPQKWLFERSNNK